MSQDEIYLQKLQDYYAQYRVIPSFSTIGKLVGLQSTSSVAALVARLKLMGFLESTPEKRLAPAPRFFERQILDSVRAGFPSPANDTLSDMLTIDQFLVERPSSTVLLTIKGDSMLDAGFMPGDVVVVEKGAPASLGDIVVAIVDNEFTVKYLEKDKNGFYLKPGNPAYPPIRPQEQLEIYGLVVGLFRKYKQHKR